MSNQFRTAAKSLLIAAAFLIMTNIGCELLPESYFDLARDSRLPGWEILPPGRIRADVSLKMEYYIKPWGRSAGFFLQDNGGRRLKKQHGSMRCREAFQLDTPLQGFPTGYPAYEAITVNGITEIIEHRKMEPIFYVTDDVAVWKHYRELGC